MSTHDASQRKLLPFFQGRTTKALRSRGTIAKEEHGKRRRLLRTTSRTLAVLRAGFLKNVSDATGDKKIRTKLFRSLFFPVKRHTAKELDPTPSLASFSRDSPRSDDVTFRSRRPPLSLYPSIDKFSRGRTRIPCLLSKIDRIPPFLFL